MSDWNLPATTSTYVDVLANLKDRDLDVAKLFDGVTVTNPVTGMIRWSSANARLEKWNGTAWEALAATHAISISGSSASTTGNAATATALQTARTINGTSFNGTANVTTSFWGAARTITIGSTGKSVNGSGNMGWSLGEIGAAASSHTHDYLPLTGGTVTGTVTVDGAINGTAVTQSATDTTAGRLTKVGDFGLGTNSVPTFPGWGVTRVSGIYISSGAMSTAGGWPVDSATSAFVIAARNSYIVIEAVSGSAGRAWLGVSSAFDSTPAWKELYHSHSTFNAATATKLKTARTINGIAFDGSGNITIPPSAPAPATLSGTAIAWGTNAKYHATISANTTLSFSSNPDVGTTCLLHVTHTGGTITWPSSVRWPGGVAPTLTTGKTHIFMFYWDGSLYRGSFLRNYATT